MTDVEEKDDNWLPQSYPIPEHWLYTELETAFENLSLTGKKLAQKNYDPAGEIPVVDQGASEIGGYSNDQEKVIKPDRPVIIFGDHTKCLKYVTFPFIPGADGVKVLLPNQGVFPKFAFYACKSLRLPDRGYSRHYSFLKKCDFPLPPFNEQKRIVAKIEELFSELDNGIAALKTVREQLKVYRQAVLKHAFEGKLTAKWREDNADKLESTEQLLARIQQEREARYRQQLEEWESAVKKWEEQGKEGKKPGKPALPKDSELNIDLAPLTLWELPLGWRWLKLCDLLQSSPQNGLYKPASDYGSGCQIIRIDNFYDGSVVNDETLKRLSVTDDEKETYGLQLGDLIVNRVNSIEYLGKSALIRRLNEPTVFESNIMRCSLVDRSISNEYVTLYLNSKSGRNELCKNAKHAVNQASINQTDVGNAFVPICSIEEQRLIVLEVSAKLDAINRTITDIKLQLRQSEALRQSILKKAFSGQLVQQDANDEPASELLARIQAEREAINTKNTKKTRKAK